MNFVKKSIKNKDSGFCYIIKEANEPIFQIRTFYDGTYSVMARIYLPEKYFFEHPTLIDLNYEQAEEACNRYVNHPVCTEEILEEWLLIGT